MKYDKNYFIIIKNPYMVNSEEEEQVMDLAQYKEELFTSDIDFLFRSFIQPFLDDQRTGEADIEIQVLENFKRHIENCISGVVFVDNMGCEYEIIKSYG